MPRIKKKTQPVWIFGTSGHAKVCADILQQQGIEAAFVSRERSSVGQLILELPVIGCDGDDNVLTKIRSGKVAYFVGIGENGERRRVTDQLIGLTGRKPVNAVHPDALISRHASIGFGNFINCGVKINAASRIGNHAILNTSAVIDHDCVIGDFAQISPGCNLGGGVQVDDEAFLGLGAVVLPQVRVGARAVVGAGAVVIGDIPSQATAVGCPAKVVKHSRR